ncbi:MAG: SAM-dependent methyltransferase [Cyanobacteria bacterium RYN_339]|nr:SAM-dependent methyltransferase [Cyanobacteria bacterium RYN_339]
MERPDYHALQTHYEACLEEHGDNHLGVNWSRQEDADRRYEVMLDLVKPGEGVSLLDFGCGAAHFYDYLRARGRTDIVYAGLDISPKFVELSRAKHPALDFYCLDVLTADAALPEFDYIVLNGVFTAKPTISHEAMWAFCQALLTKLVPHARKGLAFNAMSKHVDWERDDLFHLPFDTIAAFLHAQGWRRYTIRADYGLYDYTLYLHR